MGRFAFRRDGEEENQFLHILHNTFGHLQAKDSFSNQIQEPLSIKNATGEDTLNPIDMYILVVDVTFELILGVRKHILHTLIMNQSTENLFSREILSAVNSNHQFVKMRTKRSDHEFNVLLLDRQFRVVRLAVEPVVSLVDDDFDLFELVFRVCHLDQFLVLERRESFINS